MVADKLAENAPQWAKILCKCATFMLFSFYMIGLMIAEFKRRYYLIGRANTKNCWKLNMSFFFVKLNQWASTNKILKA